MPISLRPSVLDHAAALPMYQQLADHLRQAIVSHDLAPGEALPGEHRIAEAIEVSPPVVRRAVDLLAREGLVVKRNGAATRVAEPVQVRELDAERFRDEMALLRSGVEHPLQSAFTLDHGIAWSDYSVEVEVSKEPATRADADYLRVRLNAPVLRRRMVQLISGRPAQIHRSAMPYKLSDPEVRDPARQPWPGGTLAEQYHAGRKVTSVSIEAESRNPNTLERRLLQMDAGPQVFSIVTVFWVDDHPVEVTKQIMPTLRNRLRYRVDLS